jgi:transcriptional regulator NrdR family protein
MKCPKCGGVSHVYHKKPEAKSIRRYRKCKECGTNFITEQGPEKVVPKRSARRFSDDDVREMRAYAKDMGVGSYIVGAAFDVAPKTAHDILKRRTYKDVA